MIERVDGYKVGTGFFATIREAQVQALSHLLGFDVGAGEKVLNDLVDHSKEVVAVLTPPKELSQRATRKDKGTRRPQKTPSANPRSETTLQPGAASKS